MTYDRPRAKRGMTLTYVRWVREGDHCRVREARYEPTRRVRAEPRGNQPDSRPRRGALAAERQGRLI